MNEKADTSAEPNGVDQEPTDENGAEVMATNDSSDGKVDEVEESQGAGLQGDDVDPVVAERDAYRATLQQLQADFENYRKRMIKQQGEVSERANEALVQKLLPILDTVDLAKAHEPSGPLEQVSVAFTDVLTKAGLERITAVDQPFDPTLHEAVAHEDGDDDAPRVKEELRAGYRWKGRVLRPAMVTVIG